MKLTKSAALWLRKAFKTMTENEYRAMLRQAQEIAQERNAHVIGRNHLELAREEL